ncbi:hypothetical protein [Ottowia cancrivicina]|uniref:Uncharacterized protein n=1 Tax=Ottowia cancrivicina TaxID=3040346 RepID=A0AAW6RII4_9BURK|nr:hypothetical protein [Ottowia sp. 10c7w1]MDG9699959.1 hypothetical protein [Ottowia sp. 10c7w1]
MPLKEGLPADDFNHATMNSSARKRLRLISLRENDPAIKAGFTKTVNAASPASCSIKSKSKFSPIKNLFAAVSTGTSCYQSRSKSGCFFEPCLPCACYASGMLDSTVPGVIQHGLASLSIVKFILLLGVQ